MNPDRLTKIIRGLGLNHSEAARLLGIEPRTMRRYVSGDRVHPGIERIFRMMERRPELITVLEDINRELS